MKKLLFCALLMASGFAIASDDENFWVNELIYKKNSLYRNVLVLTNGTHVCMSFGKMQGTQSCTLKDRPEYLVLDYTKALMASLYMNANARKVLIIGMGGGSLSKAFRDYDAGFSIDAVELDPAVVEVAERFFSFKPDALSKAFVEDGRVFVRRLIREGARYDLILIDAFDSDYIPEHMLTVEFLQQVKSVLNDGGVVAANTFTDGDLSAHEFATYQHVFGKTLQLKVKSGNSIIYAGKNNPLDISPSYMELDARLSKYGVSHALLDSLLLVRPVVGHRLLTDQFSPANILLQSRHY